MLAKPCPKPCPTGARQTCPETSPKIEWLGGEREAIGGKIKGGHILGQALFSLKNLWFFEEIFWATVLGTSLANFWGLFGVLLGSFLGQLFGGIVRRSANAC